MSIEAMKQALEPMRDAAFDEEGYTINADLAEAYDTLRQAIEQAEKKEKTTVEDNSQNWVGMDGATAWHLIHRHADGWGDVGKMMDEWREANTTPQPQRPWVGLTDEELDDCYDNVEWNTVDWCPDHQQLARAVEAKLKDKNT